MSISLSSVPFSRRRSFMPRPKGRSRGLLAHSPRCGLALVPEKLAAGRMAKVEKMLEDK